MSRFRDWDADLEAAHEPQPDRSRRTRSIKKALRTFVSLIHLELQLNAGLKELRLADQPEAIERAVPIGHLEPRVVREVQFTIGVNRQNLPPCKAALSKSM